GVVRRVPGAALPATRMGGPNGSTSVASSCGGVAATVGAERTGRLEGGSAVRVPATVRAPGADEAGASVGTLAICRRVTTGPGVGREVGGAVVRVPEGGAAEAAVPGWSAGVAAAGCG